MTVLVTGGAGFIGSHIVDSLVEGGSFGANPKVVVLDDLSGGFRENVHPSAEFVEGSITNSLLIDRLFSHHKFDYVFHSAAYAAEGLSHFIRNFNYTNNLLGSINLVNNAVCHGCKCFVFLSSIAVYGIAIQLPTREDVEPHPEDPYGIAKYAVELDLEAARRMFGLNYIIFRLHNVYGERQNVGDPYRNVIGIFMNQILKGLPCPIFGDGTQTRAFTHVLDVAPIIVKSALFPVAFNRVFNIGSDVVCSVNELAGKVQMVMGKKTGVVYLPERKEVLHAYSDHSKLREILGVEPTITLSEGLKRMAGWAKLYGAKKGKPFGKIEIEKELPESWRKLC